MRGLVSLYITRTEDLASPCITLIEDCRPRHWPHCRVRADRSSHPIPLREIPTDVSRRHPRARPGADRRGIRRTARRGRGDCAGAAPECRECLSNPLSGRCVCICSVRAMTQLRASLNEPGRGVIGDGHDVLDRFSGSRSSTRRGVRTAEAGARRRRPENKRVRRGEAGDVPSFATWTKSGLMRSRPRRNGHGAHH